MRAAKTFSNLADQKPMARARKHKVFYSKILLFGEYGIIKNSMGLSIPYADYQGKLSFISGKNDKQAIASNQLLQLYLQYLWSLKNKGKLFDFDLDRFESDLYNGLYFDSTIPQGFGVGSSGALSAALYDQYAHDRIEPENLGPDKMMELKKVLGLMESFYHGKSSGLDPLISYLNLPVLLKSKSELNSIKIPESDGRGAIFLLDTGNPSETQPLVQWFAGKCRQHGFVRLFKDRFIPYNDECITSFLKGKTRELYQNLYHLSKFLFDHLNPMIPELFRKVWMKGLDTGAFHLKLCGSGGGGYLLGFTEDFESAQKHFADYQIKEVLSF